MAHVMTIKQKSLERVSELGLMAVDRGPSPELTIDTVDALINGEVLGIEITYTTPGAAEVVKSLDDKFSERILLGMGTRTRIEQFDEAKSAVIGCDNSQSFRKAKSHFLKLRFDNEITRLVDISP